MEVDKCSLFVGSNESGSELSLCHCLRKPYMPCSGQVTLRVIWPSREALTEPPQAQWPSPKPFQDNIHYVVHQLLMEPAGKPDH